MHSTIKNLRAPSTNQFHVNEQLKGLVEKFRILNNEELAEALQERLVGLSNRKIKWLPEILLLLMQLSQNPVLETRLEDLALLERPPSPPPLTWAQLLAEDPLGSDDGLWDNVSFGDDTSEDNDELTPARSPNIRAQSIDSDSENEFLAELEHDSEAPRDTESLQMITKGQYWNPKNEAAHKDGAVLLTETQVIREVIFMLLGLPTNIFESNCLGLADRFCIKFTSKDALGHILESFTSVGTQLIALRKWVAQSNMIPMAETLQAGLRVKLRDFHLALSKIESHILHPAGQMPVTLLTLHCDVHRLAQPLLRLFSSICEGDIQAMSHQFLILDSLYNLICSSEYLDDVGAIEYYLTLFLPSLRTYLIPAHLWMETGELDSGRGEFFVKRQESDPAMTCLWSNQYGLLRSENHSLQVPQFMSALVSKMFNAGRSISFLHSLGLYIGKPYIGEQPVPPFEFGIDYWMAQLDTFTPFSECFTSKLSAWVSNHHHQSSSSLRKAMDTRCGLWTTLDALEHIYFSRNGALTNQIAAIIFERIDQRRCSWNDPFVLTERFRDIYGQLPCICADQLTVDTTNPNDDKWQDRSRSMDCLTTISITYKLPWAVANVITQESLTIYQQIGIELLQLLRAKHILERKTSGIFSNKNNANGSAAIAIALRHRQLCFLNNLRSYLAIILSKVSTDMRTKMETSNDMDEIIATHTEFVSHLHDQCLLSERHITTYQAIVSVLDLVIVFSDLCKPSNQGTLVVAHSAQTLRRKSVDTSDNEDLNATGSLVPEKSEAAQLAMMKQMSVTFSKLLGYVLAGLREACRSGAEPTLRILLESMAIFEGY